MGSLFLVVIPIRSHELKLRLIENDILTTMAIPVQAPEDNKEAIVKTMRKAKAVHSLAYTAVSEDPGIPAKDITLPSTKEKTFAYTMNKDGANLLLQVTRDTMKLALAEAENGMNSPNSASSAGSSAGSSASLETDSIQGFDSPPPRARRGSMEADFDLHITELIDSQFLEKHMADSLTRFELLTASWETSIDGHFSQICFSTSESKADEIINHLHTVGIGKKYASTLTVCATSVFTQEQSGNVKRTASEEEVFQEKKGKWNSFVQSIKARLTVAQVVQNVKANATLTFDFIVMLIVAGIIASLGLLEDSPVNLIASMLVSPLMGPIMAFTFGAMIRDTALIKTGVVAELLGLFICLVIGLLFGIVLELKPIEGPWAHVKRWPTAEMYGRAKTSALIVGAGIAIPSGAGVALSILAGNAGSLVGVAISASLLPPCVNCGIFYGSALIIAIQEIGNGNNPFTSSCDESIGMNYTRSHPKLYCKNSMRELALMGTISLCLTLLNIVLIFFTGIICLKIKEVAPYTTKTAFERFWKQDVKYARDYNKTHTGHDSLLHDLADDPQLLNVVQDDFVFSQIQTRAMYRDENVITKVKETKSKAAVELAGTLPDGGGSATNWLTSWWSSSSTKGDDKSMGAVSRRGI